MPDASSRRALIRAALLVAAAVLVGSCRWWASEVPRERLPSFEPLAAKPRLALVLGSGGPRGFAHIGVMKVLEENGVKPDLIIGSSVGAMVGALSAAGMSALQLEQLSEKLRVADFFELGMIGIGKASGAVTQNYVNEHLANRTIEQLRIPFAAAATRVRDRQLVLFNRGDTGLAVRASSANPDSFEPVRVGAEMYLDGDLASPVPIRAARALGARVVIAVDVSAYAEDTPPSVPSAWIASDTRRARQVALEAPEADVLLHPNIGYYAGHNDAYRRRVIAAAEAYTRKQLPAIRAALARANAQAMETERMPSGVASR